jgi:hypothetical protein
VARKVELVLASLRVGDAVTLVDAAGARFSGVVVQKRRGLDKEQEVGLRRAGGSISWIPFERVRSVE